MHHAFDIFGGSEGVVVGGAGACGAGLGTAGLDGGVNTSACWSVCLRAGFVFFVVGMLVWRRVLIFLATGLAVIPIIFKARFIARVARNIKITKIRMRLCIHMN